MLLGCPQPGNEYYDAFEKRKQIGEVFAFALGALAIVVLV